MVGGEVDAFSLACQQVNDLLVFSRGNTQELKCMGRDIDADMRRDFIEVDHDEQHFIVLLTQESILLMLVEVPVLIVDVHEVEELSVIDAFLLFAQIQQAVIEVVQFLFVLLQQLSFKLLFVAPAGYGVDVPIVKNGCTSVAAAETFALHSSFTELLPEVNHYRVRIHAGGDNHTGASLAS